MWRHGRILLSLRGANMHGRKLDDPVNPIPDVEGNPSDGLGARVRAFYPLRDAQHVPLYIIILKLLRLVFLALVNKIISWN
jgi:hypothetical protein